jgi:hypothetical protein
MSKDLLEEQLFMDKVTDEHVIVMVDVDYYTDIRRWMCYGRPILLYTMVADAAAGVHSDGAWEITYGSYTDTAGCASYEGSVVRCLVNGGASYEHPLWDYNHDNLSVIDWYGNCLTYYVEQRRCPSGRRIVGLFPGSSVAFPYWYQVPRKPLKRFECMVGNVAVVDRGNGTLSISCPGAFEALEVSRIDYTGWKAKAAAVGLKHVVDVEKWMSVSENQRTKEARIRWAPVLFGLLQQGWEPSGCVSIVQNTGVTELIPAGPLLQVEHYVCDHPAAPGSTTTGGEIAVAFAPPLVTHPNPVPAKCMANAAMAHQVRVADTQKKFAGHSFKPDLGAYAVEFVRLVVGESKGMVSPLEISELAELWVRPTQAATVAGLHTEVQPQDEPREMRGFMKGEPGYKPRQIVNCDGDHNAPLATYTLAIMNNLKGRHPWVGCGRTPVEVEERVNSVSTGLCVPDELRDRLKFTKLTEAHEGDITNCDGSEKRWHRDHITDPIMLGLITGPNKPSLRVLLRQEAAGFKVKMAEGYRYTAGWELISGTSATTLKNILKVAFGDFVALRRCGLSVTEAFSCLGVYCGDDSVCVALPLSGLAEARVVAMAELAMDQKLIVRLSPYPVSFLGEFHYGAFFDVGQRLPDFWRQAQKCHLSCNRGVTVDVAAANKAKGALSSSTLSDPILGPWFTQVALLSGEASVGSMTREERWKLDTETTSHRDRLALRSEVVDLWCDVTGVERSELDEIVAAIWAAESLSQLPSGVLDNVLTKKSLLPGTANSSGTVVPVEGPAPGHNDQSQQSQGGAQGPRNPPPGGRGRPSRPQNEARARTSQPANSRNPRQLQRGGARALQPGRGRRPAA